ncbi:MAG: hypothetical protein CME19_21995 [Gemmatimonadetes bacterium]|mgnify:CR=1 FL=1|nr:hypothetical protein [Gemmatimonadota bacterium]
MSWTLNLATISQLSCVRDALSLKLQTDGGLLTQAMFDKVDAWVQEHDRRVKSGPLHVIQPK